MSFWSSEWISDALWALYTADYPLFVGYCPVAGATPNGWYAASDYDYANDANGLPRCAFDGYCNVPAKAASGFIPGISGAAEFRFSIADLVSAWDSIAIFGHNFGDVSAGGVGAYVDLEIADNGTFTAGLARLKRWSVPAHSTKRLVSFELNHTPPPYTFTGGTPGANINVNTSWSAYYWDRYDVAHPTVVGDEMDWLDSSPGHDQRTSNGTGSAQKASAWVGPTDFGNQRMVVTVSTGGHHPTAAQAAALGIVFGWQDDQHFYLLDWRKTADPLDLSDACGLRLKVVNGSGLRANDFFDAGGSGVSTLASDAVTWDYSTDYTITIDFIGGIIHVLVEDGSTGIAEFTVADTTYSTGKFGFFENNDLEREFGPVTIADVDAETTGLNARAYAGAAHARIVVTPLAGALLSAQPYLGEIMLGARRQLSHGPTKDTPYDDEDFDGDAADFDGEVPSQSRVVRFAGRKAWDFSLTFASTAEANVLRNAWKDTGYGASHVLFAPKPYSAPEQSILTRFPMRLPIPLRQGSVFARTAELSLREIAPFWSSEV